MATPSGRKVSGVERKEKNNHTNIGHFVPLQSLRALHELRLDKKILVHTLHSDQLCICIVQPAFLGLW